MGVCAGHNRTRWASGLLFGLLLVFVVGAVLVPAAGVARAQEAEEKKKDGEETAKKKLGDTNLFTHIIESAGWFFGPLLFLVSIGLVTLIVLLAMDLRMSVAVPPAFVDDFTDTINKRQFKPAYELCRSDNSFLARVLTAGMSRLQYGIEDAREAALNMAESVKAGKEQMINYLATIGTLGPMLGLVGTVFGMVLAFMRLGSSTGAPDPAGLASDISHALVVTLLGVAIAVPAIFTHTMFRNRLIRISMDTSTLADDLLTQIYHNSKKPAAAGAGSVDTRTASGSFKPAE